MEHFDWINAFLSLTPFNENILCVLIEYCRFLIKSEELLSASATLADFKFSDRCDQKFGADDFCNCGQ